MKAAFERDPSGSNVFFGTEWAAGPWDPRACHGGGPAALAVRAAEEKPAPSPMAVARLTLELMRPAPVDRLIVHAEVIREGKKLQLVAVTIRSSQHEVARGMVLKLRVEDLSAACSEAVEDPSRAARFAAIAPPERCEPQSSRLRTGFSGLFELRSAGGGLLTVGPGAVWFRMTGQIVAGETPSPAMRAAAVADFTNGVSGALPFDRWTYINPDLTINLAREAFGDWIILDAATTVSAHGRGVASGGLGDETGWFGHVSQTLLIDARK
ncbi:thioesterase family protein [bacterium]|nr:thioesterase family protein [bacterium]